MPLILLSILLALCACQPLAETGNHQSQAGAEMDVPVDLETYPVTITILYDNIRSDDRLATEWGYSALVEIHEHTVLFDTGGDAPTLLNNMQILEVDTAAIEHVFLSHAHGDHAGGLEGLLAVNSQPIVHLLPSFPQDLKDRISRITTVEEVEQGQSIATGIFTTGEMGTRIPEHGLVLRTSKGLVVITGCAHPGIVQIVERAQALFGGPIYLVMGGFHLRDHNSAQIEPIVDSFRSMGVLHVAPSHCTGDAAIEAFRHEYGPDFIEAGVGRVIVIEP
jgi:7,8-dihydropterin-6-yl-methyl-4-(beta-D-ribofuranosyl)aminobenzene 5'-phosphate synthase